MPRQRGYTPSGDPFDVEICVRTNLQTGSTEVVVEYWSADSLDHEAEHDELVRLVEAHLGYKPHSITWKPVPRPGTPVANVSPSIATPRPPKPVEAPGS